MRLKANRRIPLFPVVRLGALKPGAAWNPRGTKRASRRGFTPGLPPAEERAAIRPEFHYSTAWERFVEAARGGKKVA